MSKYTVRTLAENVRIGQGYIPWWASEADRLGIDRTVWSRPGFLTLEEVEQVIGQPIATEPVISSSTFEQVDGWVRVFNARTQTTLCMAGANYQVHDPTQWLLQVAEPLVAAAEADGLGITTALTLGDGAMSCLTLGLPEQVRTNSGMALKPYTALKTSADRTLATATHNGLTVVVCDNTARMAEHGTLVGFKVRHTSKSSARRADYARVVADAHGYAEQAAAAIDVLAEIPVTAAQWDRILSKVLGDLPDDAPQATRTRRENVEAEIRAMAVHDTRCAPWRGTALGAWQTLNTHATHKATVRGAHRAVRQAERMVRDEDLDAKFFAAIASVIDLSSPVLV